MPAVARYVGSLPVLKRYRGPTLVWSAVPDLEYPSAGDDEFFITEGAGSVDLLLTENDQTSEGTAWTLGVASVGGDVAARVTIGEAGLVSFDKSGLAPGAYTFTYTITEIDGGSATATVTLHIAEAAAVAPAAPVAGSLALTALATPTGDSATVTFSAVPDDGGAEIIRTLYRTSADAVWTAWRVLVESAPVLGEPYTMTGLTPDTPNTIEFGLENLVNDGVNAGVVGAFTGNAGPNPAPVVTPTYSAGLTEDTSGELESTGTAGVYRIVVTAPDYYACDVNRDTANWAAGPILVIAPPISGTLAAGEVLTGYPALWWHEDEDDPFSRAYRWESSPAGTDTWTSTGETTQSRTFASPADDGLDFRRVEIATSAAGSVESVSNVLAGEGTAPAEWAAPQVTAGTNSATYTTGGNAPSVPSAPSVTTGVDQATYQQG